METKSGNLFGTNTFCKCNNYFGMEGVWHILSLCFELIIFHLGFEAHEKVWDLVSNFCYMHIFVGLPHGKQKYWRRSEDNSRLGEVNNRLVWTCNWTGKANRWYFVVSGSFINFDLLLTSIVVCLLLALESTYLMHFSFLLWLYFERFTWRMKLLTGHRGVGILYAYMLLGLGFLRTVTPEFGDLISQEQQLEGTFR